MKVTTKVATKSLMFVSAALITSLALRESGVKTINTVCADKLACGGSTAVSNTVTNSGMMTPNYKPSY